MNYTEARKYMDEALRKGSILGLENISHLMDELGNIQEQLNVIHVAGTNGKGSTSAVMESILSEAGYTVGRYTSPAVFEYLEIFKINNVNISENEYAQIMTQISTAVENMQSKGYETPTAFEIETALAYVYFYQNKCDFVIMETGLGGRYDATNVIKNTLVSVITSISMDHMQFLGNTLEEIAWNKAGIIKSNSAVITSRQQQSVLNVIKSEADLNNSEYRVTNEASFVIYSLEKTQFNYTSINDNYYENIQTEMLGTFQPQNICTAIEVMEYLVNKGFCITKENMMKGIQNTIWHGRFEKISSSPDVYFDGGHNPGAAENIRRSIEIYFTNKKIVYIIGVLADKDYRKVLELTAPLADMIYTITPDNKRALNGEKLRENALKYNKNVQYVDQISKAVHLAKASAGKEGIVIIFGSLSYLKEVGDAIHQI